MNKPCLVDSRIINRLKQRQTTQNYNLFYVIIGIIIGIVLTYLFNNKEQFVANLPFKKMRKSYKIDEDLSEEEIEYRGPPHNIYL